MEFLIVPLVVIVIVLWARRTTSKELLGRIGDLTERLDDETRQTRVRVTALEVRLNALASPVAGSETGAPPDAPDVDAPVARAVSSSMGGPVPTVGGRAPTISEPRGAARFPYAPAAPRPPVPEPRPSLPPPPPESPPHPGPSPSPAPWQQSSSRVAEEPAAQALGPSPVSVWIRGLREQLASDEWEAVVGASWLNKIGSLLLVTGIALFLGYSFVNLGPAGRVSLGYALSVTMLVSGVVLERRDRYRLFARGLIGGGWAAVYYTTYAMYGLDAARVLDNALLASAALLVVAAGMIAHSLRYRSEALTGLTFVVGFFTLAISPTSAFSIAASIPLVATLLVVAHRLRWDRMPVYGVLVTYFTYVAHFVIVPPPAPTVSGYYFAQATLGVYWLLFEVFDLAGLGKPAKPNDFARALFPLNATGFFGVSLLQWSPSAPLGLSTFFGVVGGAYVASALLRARLRRPSSFEQSTRAFERVLLGGYEASITVAAAAGAAAIVLGADGLRIPLALLIEGQALFVAGMSLRERYLRGLATVLLLAAVLWLGVRHVPELGDVAFYGLTLRPWTPLALLTAAVLYLNRWLLRTTEPLVAAEQTYSYVASGLIVLALGVETPVRYVAIAWLAFMFVLFEIAVRRDAGDFRRQAYVVGALALAALLFVNVRDAVDAAFAVWPPLAVAAVASYGFVVRVARLPGNQWPEREILRCVSSAAGVVALAALSWLVVPREDVGLAWLALALAQFEIGQRYSLADFRYEAYVLGLAALGALGGINALAIGTQAVRPWLGLGAGAALVYGGAARIIGLGAARLPPREATGAVTVASLVGTVLLATFCWYALPAPVVTVAWALIGLVLVELGLLPRLAVLRSQGHALALLALGRTFMANFTIFGETGGVSHRLLTVVPLIALCYHVWARLRGPAERGELRTWEPRVVRLYHYVPVVLAAVLMRFELGRTSVVLGWALLGLGLLFGGVRWANRDLRYQSYALAVLTFLRAWTTNFYAPESLAGDFGRLVTGVIVVACFYASLLLSPRSRELQDTGGGLLLRWAQKFDAHARLAFSVLGTLLLTTLLYFEVSGAWLTVAWGLEGVGLLVAGFVLRERSLRFSGLALLALCILKLFVYDLSTLATFYRILSFAVLGFLLLCVSWTYTRFQSQLRRYF